MEIKEIEDILKRYKDDGFESVDIELKNKRVIGVVFNEDKILWHKENLFIANNCFNIAIKYCEIECIAI